jgi:hypothetical protein
LNYELDKQTSDDRLERSPKYFINIRPAGDQHAFAEALKIVNIKNKRNSSEQINLPPSAVFAHREISRERGDAAENKLHLSSRSHTHTATLFLCVRFHRETAAAICFMSSEMARSDH